MQEGEGKRTLVGGKHDVGRHAEVDGDQVGQGVVFLEEEEVGAVGHAWTPRGLEFWVCEATSNGAAVGTTYR